MNNTDEKTKAAKQRRQFAAKGVIALMVVMVLGVGWLVLRSSDTPWKTIETDLYSVKIPDGWTVAHFTSSGSIVDADCASCLTYRPGTKAEILKYETLSGGEDNKYPFLLRPRTTNQKDEATFFEGYEKTGTILSKNVSGNKYYKVTTAPDNWHGRGHTTYGYAFTKGSNIIFITHTFGTGGKDRHEMVEKLIRTLELK